MYINVIGFTTAFSPQLELGAFAQMPYEAITKERYEEILAGLSSTTPDFLAYLQDADALANVIETPADAFCDACEQP